MHPKAPALMTTLPFGRHGSRPVQQSAVLLRPALLARLARVAVMPLTALMPLMPLVPLTALLHSPSWANDAAHTPAARAPAAAKVAAAAPALAADKGPVSGGHKAPEALRAKGMEKGHDADHGKAPAAGAQVAVAPLQPPGASDDPMERLRLRLGEKLTTAKPSTSTAGPLEVRVLAKAPPVQGGGGPGGGPGGGKSHKADKHEKGSGAHAAHWSYAGPAGPQTWGGLKPEFSLCAKGQRQSPIDIQGGLPVDLEPVQFHYKASRFAVVDNGHTVQANLGSGNYIEVGGRRFELLQFHFHRPSEERIDGRQFDMSLHLVHKDDQGRLAVVGLLLDRGAPHPTVQKVWNNLPLEKQQEQPARVLLELNELLPSNPSYYTYMGSLTTPPCSEGVQWIVMRQPVSVSMEQIELFSRLYPMNARPVQQVSGRRILQTP